MTTLKYSPPLPGSALFKRALPALGVALVCVLGAAPALAREPAPLVPQAPVQAPSRSAAPAGFGQCRQFFPTAQPPRVPPAAAQAGAPPLRELCYEAFATLYSGRSKTPLYTVQRLTRELLDDAQDEERARRRFFPDARLPRSERATPDDYKGSGLDRGHMAPAADMPSPAAMEQSFSMANVVPQARVNNQRTWAGIERATRQYARRAQGPVYVFTGPVFATPQPRTIGDNDIWVPTHLYKLVYDPAANRAWAHWVENRDDAHAGPPISYAELVKRTGIEFLPGVAVGR